MRTHTPPWLPILAVVLPFALACNEDVSAPASEVPTPTLEELANAPETLDLGQHQYQLATYLWRDFMPISPPDGKPMIGRVHLVRTDEGPATGDVELVYLWVVNRDRVWATTFEEGSGPDRVARGGPKWEPGIYVNVVVAVKSGSSGIRLLQAPAQLIHLTT